VSLFKRKLEGRGSRAARLGASLALVLGLMTGVFAALVGTTAAYAGSVTTNYSCPSPVGTETLPITVSETPDVTGNVQIGTVLTESVTVSAAIPGSLLDLAGGAGATSLPVASAGITINGVNVGAASQTTAAAAGVLPITIPVIPSGNPPANITIPMAPLTWTAGPATGPASLTPGALAMNVAIALNCTPAAGTAAMDTFNVTSPPTAPVVVSPQSASVSSGQSTTINVLAGATDIGDTINPASVAIATPPTNGTAVANPDGTVTYTNNGSAATTDSFTFTVKSSTGLTSLPGTVNISVSFNTCSAGHGNAAGGSTGTLGTCSLSQLILLPVEPGQIVLSQNGGLPLDVLGSSFCAGGTTPGITLNGQEQTACGILSPLTVTNATGLDTGWTLTGQVTDFIDPSTPGNTCDTTATYNNHCIPGGNLAWVPASGVAHNVVAGDTAQVTSGATIAPPQVFPPTVANPILGGAVTQPNPVVEVPAAAGLHSTPQTLCSTASGQAGGTFICGAGLELAVPASIAEPVVDSHIGAPAYEATITLTLF
jgi:hypothetical protein